MLRPQQSATRELLNLDGIWKFKVDFNDEGFAHKWFDKPISTDLDAPVPASYNDIFTDIAIREHVGWVWYERTVFVPRGWSGEDIFVRADSATHEGVIFINGEEVVRHVGGYMPFEAEISSRVKAGEEVRITIGVNNVLTNETIPPGEVVTSPAGAKVQTYLHDFYNYAGLARSIWLYSAPKKRVTDITVTTTYSGSTGNVKYVTDVTGGDVSTKLLDESGVVVATGEGASSDLTVPNVKLWQPGAAYLYKLVWK